MISQVTLPNRIIEALIGAKLTPQKLAKALGMKSSEIPLVQRELTALHRQARITYERGTWTARTPDIAGATPPNLNGAPPDDLTDRGKPRAWPEARALNSAILALLEERPRMRGEICERLGVDPSTNTIDARLSSLKKSRLISSNYARPATWSLAGGAESIELKTVAEAQSDDDDADPPALETLTDEAERVRMNAAGLLTVEQCNAALDDPRGETRDPWDFCALCKAGDLAINGVHRGQDKCGFLLEIQRGHARIAAFERKVAKLEAAASVPRAIAKVADGVVTRRETLEAEYLELASALRLGRCSAEAGRVALDALSLI